MQVSKYTYKQFYAELNIPVGFLDTKFVQRNSNNPCFEDGQEQLIYLNLMPFRWSLTEELGLE